MLYLPQWAGPTLKCVDRLVWRVILSRVFSEIWHTLDHIKGELTPNNGNQKV